MHYKFNYKVFRPNPVLNLSLASPMTAGRKPAPRRSIRMRLLILLVLALILSLPLEIAAHSLYVSIGARDATVTLDTLELGLTDYSGLFYSEPVLPGMHVLRLEKEGYRTFLDTIFVPQGLTYNHTLPLEPLRVIVINEQTGLETDSVGGPYTIQVGSFRNMDNARRTLAAFREDAYEPRLESAELSGLGLVHRVRLSQFGSLEQAKQAALKIAGRHSQDVWIVGLDGRDWAVQLGAFSTRADAAALAARIVYPGIYLWIEHRADELFRVKAGYWPDRDSAQAAAQSLGKVAGAEPFVIQVR